MRINTTMSQIADRVALDNVAEAANSARAINPETKNQILDILRGVHG